MLAETMMADLPTWLLPMWFSVALQGDQAVGRQSGGQSSGCGGGRAGGQAGGRAGNRAGRQGSWQDGRPSTLARLAARGGPERPPPFFASCWLFVSLFCCSPIERTCMQPNPLPESTPNSPRSPPGLLAQKPFLPFVTFDEPRAPHARTLGDPCSP